MGLRVTDFKSVARSLAQSGQFSRLFWTKCAVGHAPEYALIHIIMGLPMINLSMDLGVATCKYKVKSPSLLAVHPV